MSSHHNSGGPANPPPNYWQIDGAIELGQLPDTTAGANWSPGAEVDAVTEFDSSAKGLEVPHKDTGSARSVVFENFGNVTFQDMADKFFWVSTNAAGTQSDQWAGIGVKINDALVAFQQALETEEAKGEWQGKTHDAAKSNLSDSLAEPQAIIAGIGVYSKLLLAFSDTMFQTRWYFMSRRDAYRFELQAFPHHADQVRQGFDAFAQAVLKTVYQPNIQLIADENPAFNSGQTVDVDPPTPSGGGDSGGGDSGGGDSGGDDSALQKQLDDLNKQLNSSGGDNSALQKQLDDLNKQLNSAPPPPPAPPPNDPGPPPLPKVETANLNGSGGPNDPNANGTGGPNDPNVPNPSNLLSLPNSTSGLSNLLGGQDGGGASDGFSPSQLPGGPDANFNALPLPGGSDGGVDLSPLPGGSDGGVDPLPLPGGPSDGSSGLSGLGDLGSGLSGLGSPGGGASGGGSAGGASGLGNQLSSAPGSAADALKQAEGAGQSPGGGVPGGMPGMDPKGLDPAKGAGPGGARAGGGGGAGLGGRGLDLSKPPGAPVAGLGKEPALTNTGASRSGMPGQAGAAGGSGSGSPPGGGGGGQRGPAGKEHKANKALRRKRNGELIIGEPDAVVPVIGDDGTDSEAAEVSVPQAPVPAAAPPARWTAPAASAGRAAAKELRAELEL